MQAGRLPLNEQLAHFRMTLMRNQALAKAFIALSRTSRCPVPASSPAAIRRRILPARSRGRTLASSVLYWAADFFTGAAGHQSPRTAGCIRFRACARARDSSSRRPQHAQQRKLRISAQLPQALIAQSHHDDRVRAGGISLAALAGARYPCPGGQLVRPGTRSPLASNRCASGHPIPFAPSTAQTRSGHCRAHLTSSR
jgi:hypothetical protein